MAAIATFVPLVALVGSLRALDKPDDARGREFFGHMEVVMQQMGWNLAQATAATTTFKTHNAEKDSWAFEAAFAIGYELHRTGTALPFASTGPCIIYIPDGIDIYGGKGISVGTIERSLGQPHAKFSIDKQVPIGRDLMVVYRRAGGHCPVGTTNRYVLSDEEKLMFARWGKLAAGKAEPVKLAGPNHGAFMVNLDNLHFAVIRLARVESNLIVELHSNQLRGDTYNGGFLEIGMIEAPRLTFRGADGRTTEVEIEKGLVGGRGAFTPIRATASIPDGVYDITLEANVFPAPKLAEWPADFSKKKPVKIELAKGHRVGG